MVDRQYAYTATAKPYALRLFNHQRGVTLGIGHALVRHRRLEEPKGVPLPSPAFRRWDGKACGGVVAILPCDMVTVKLALGTLNPFSALTEMDVHRDLFPLTLATACNDSSPLVRKRPPGHHQLIAGAGEIVRFGAAEHAVRAGRR